MHKIIKIKSGKMHFGDGHVVKAEVVGAQARAGAEQGRAGLGRDSEV